MDKEKIWQDTIPFGKQFITVSVNTDDLRRDLIKEGLRQNAGAEEIGKMAQDIKFVFSPGDNQESKLLKSGSTAFVNNKKKICAIDINSVSKVFGCSEIRVGNNVWFKTDNHRLEVKQMAAKQYLDAVWRHERQHLIDFALSKEFDNETEFLDRTSRNAVLATAAHTTLWCILVAFADSKLQTPPAVLLSAMGIGTAAAVWWNIGRFFKYVGVNHPCEEFPYELTKSQYFQDSPFKVSFEE